ncbi:unnamed protein product [[Candida] boidinii]|nr:unnamed protein product [[Candida] boidinii]
MLENEGLADIQPFDSNNKEEQINDESESDANNSSSDDNTARSKNSSSEIKDSSTGDITKDQEASKLDKPNGSNSGSTDDSTKNPIELESVAEPSKVLEKDCCFSSDKFHMITHDVATDTKETASADAKTSSTTDNANSDSIKKEVTGQEAISTQDSDRGI